MLGQNALKIHSSTFIPLLVLIFDLRDNILRRFHFHLICILSPDLGSLHEDLQKLGAKDYKAAKEKFQF